MAAPAAAFGPAGRHGGVQETVHAGGKASAASNPVALAPPPGGPNRGGHLAAQARTKGSAAKQPPPSASFKSQLTQGLAAALREGRGEVTLKLSPRSLGEVRVQVRIDGGSVEASMRPATVEARALLEQSVETLRHALEARGLQVSKIEIEPVPIAREGAETGSPHRAQDAHQEPQGQDGRQQGHGSGEQRSPAEPGGRGAAGREAPGAGAPQESEIEEAPAQAGGPGAVYRDADGAARNVLIDALA